MRRILMGVIKVGDTYYARKYVPDHLQEAVARVLETSKPRVSWLKRSLRTKDLTEANIRAKPVLAGFDRILAKAAAFVQQPPLVQDLSQIEIARLAQYQYASMLEEDEEVRREGSGSEAVFQETTQQLVNQGAPFTTSFRSGGKPRFGLSEREMLKLGENVEGPLVAARAALARGDLSFIEDELDELLDAFRINLDRQSATYRQLGAAVLKAYVRALEGTDRRNQGEAIDTPRIMEPKRSEPTSGDSDTLSAALDGWKKARQATATTTREFDHAVRRFLELHGDPWIRDINRRHVREFREALQAIPLRRSGFLRTASLTQLVEWSKDHPEADTISPATVNKLLGGVQAVCVWGRDNGLIPDDQPWADPFSKMRLEEDEPEREPWQIAELRTLFASPVFAQHVRPRAGRGEAAYWLPLLGLFTGARQGELAPLTVARIGKDEATGIHAIAIARDEARGVRLKTPTARRTIPVHPELDRLGFLDFVDARRKVDGPDAALFPLLQPGPRGGYAEGWSKWFGRYIRDIGINNPNRVFHSLRHSFKDALRAGGVNEDVNDALLGQSGGGVGRSYGAKDMVYRFGFPRLAEAVSKAAYPGLDLSHLYPAETT